MKVPAAERAVAIVGVGALLPDAPNAKKFWQNVREGRYSIKEVIPERWDPNSYYDPDPKAPDKTYSKIGGWVRDWEWDPLKWRLPIPPRVSMAMDLTQKWAVVTAREALSDYGYPSRPLNAERTAVILGNAMAGDTHLYSAARILFPEYASELEKSPSYSSLPIQVRREIMGQLLEGVRRRMPPITEDTMPGELANIVAGRIAALYDFKGPNFVADAACASAMAAISAALEGLNSYDYDAVLTGGIDTNMSPSTFVKFCKIGALSATGTRPYAEGSDGFVMGEGAVTFLMKRLADAERNGDRVYAVIRGIGGSSDGKGKGITAPNPAGQKICIRRAWQNAGVAPSPGDLIEGHGTSTPVGDVAELESLSEVFNDLGLPRGSIALGSVKSNIGHLKGAAGAAGILKALFALNQKELPPSLNFNQPNPNFDFKSSPFYVNTKLEPWEVSPGGVRRAAVSAFGFGGTNFHIVMEEYIPGRIKGEIKVRTAVAETIWSGEPSAILKTPLRGALVIGADSESGIIARLRTMLKEAEAGKTPAPAPPFESDLRAEMRLSIDYANAGELADKIGKALKAFEENQPARWKALRPKGIFIGKGPAPRVAFLFTGQGSQYVNMVKTLRETEPIVAHVFEEADQTMTPLLGKSLTSCIYLDESDEAALAAAENGLKQTAITQPAVLATETALSKLLHAYGISPDMVMGHSLGEYGALVAAGAISFEEALRAVSARGNEMTRCALDDNGMMAAVFGPIDKIEKILGTIDEYVVIANINSSKEAVIGGTTLGVEKAMVAVRDAGFVARPLQVSHAFHTKIVAPAGDSLAKILSSMNICPPAIPIISNVTGEFYPMGPGVVPDMISLLGRQVSSPVQFIKGLNTLYAAGARLFVEMGPKRILYGFVEDVLGEREGVISLFTNHPRIGEAASVNLALCGLYAAGLGLGVAQKEISPAIQVSGKAIEPPIRASIPAPVQPTPSFNLPKPAELQRKPVAGVESDRYTELGRLFAEFLDRGFQVYSGGRQSPPPVNICITGAALGLPGVDRVFDDSNVERILRGDVFINAIPMNLRQAMVEKNITRLVKSESGEGRFESIENLSDVIKLAARAKDLDIIRDFGFPEERTQALDRVTKLAIGAGIDALRDAGLPLVMHYKTTTKGTKLPDRWMLPEEIRDDTGILFTSAFPGYDSYEQIISDFYKDRIRRERLEELNSLQALALKSGNGSGVAEEIRKRMDALRREIENNVYHFDRRFLFRVLSMGHSQFAEYIGARGPNTSTNGACASGTQAIGIASDWIRTGRCRRVVIISADDITSDNLMGWFGSGFLASGSAATDEIVEEAATPFDRRRHGLIIGMGASAIVMESLESARERGVRPICEVLGSVLANSAYHGTRLDVSHIRYVMERLIANAETEWGINRYQIAPETVFVSHETYTPARGGSASAEVFALRHVFKEAADQIIVANTKGATGHPMAVGIEDVVSVKILETGIVPAVPNFKEVDPELGYLNLSKGGSYPVRYALRLGAGFGSQICMTLMRWSPTPDGKRPSPSALGYQYRIENREAWNNWLKRLTGYDKPDLEVVQRTLRARDQGPAARINGNGSVAQIPLKPAAHLVETVAPAAVAAVAAVVEKQVSPAAVEKDAVQTRVMQIIAEKTGYPTDMLDLDLDLEADLGIDTVKQAEMFAAIRAAYDIPREDTLKLRDFPTLAHAVKYVYDRRPDLKALAVSSEKTPVQEGKPSPVAVSSKGAGDAVQQEVLKIIAEKTGYPPDMLDLDLDLEADLGIDTVKQAEMFAAIRAAYDIPREDTLKLRDFPTLAHAVKYVYDRRPDLKASDVSLETVPAEIANPSPAPAESKPAGDAVQQEVLKIIAEKTGYPPDMLDLDLDLEADLGIDTVKQAEMFAAIRAAYDIPREDTLKLRDFPTLAHAVEFVYDRRPDLKPAVVVKAAVATAAPSVFAQPAAPLAASETDSVKAKVLEIIAEKTGYPSDMLDLDLDLEADLGIDTVKQAEMFAAIRAAYDIPREDTLKLRDFPTLAHTIQFVYDRKPELMRRGAVQPGAATKPAIEAHGTPATGAITGSLEAANSVPRRVPSPQLRPPLALCKSTGILLQPGIRVIVMPDQGGIGKALVARLEKLGVQALVIDGAPDAKFLAKYIETWKEAGPISGVYWLPALDSQGPITGLSFAQWREATRIRSKLLFTTMQALDDQASEQGAFLISATRLGGLHGYDEAGAADPLGGAVTGFTKAYKREKGKVIVKVVDFEPSRKTSALADLLIEETLRDPGAVEIGHKDGQRWTIGLKEQAANGEAPGLELNKDSVFLITGAAGSIVSAITSDLAAASGGIFYLLDLTPEPDSGNSDLQRLLTDRENLKRDIFERLKLRGERATPAMVDKELAVLERSRAALDAIQAVKNAGGTAYYSSLDLLDNAAVDRVVKKIAEQHGHIDVLMHAAGLEISHRLPDKKSGEFDLVFDVKSDGWFNLISSIGSMPLGAAVVFSSVAGRFGNSGQTDYSSANDLLCKCISSLRSTHPETRGIAIDWTAWSGIGMAARGSIPAIMKQAGIDMLPPEAGIPIVRRELTAGFAGEIVIGQKLGILMQEFDPQGGLDVSTEGPLGSLLRDRGVMTGEVMGMGLYSGLTVETSLDPAKQPFLYDHQINATPVLPGVMGIEAMAEAAKVIFPERCIGAIENVSFLTPFKFYRNQPRTVTVHVDFYAEKDEIIAECRLTGSRTLHGQTEPEITTHFAARIRLTAGMLQSVKEENPAGFNGETKVEAPDIYSIYFHGPAYQVIQNAWKSGEYIVGQYAKNLPDNHVPAELPVIVSPRLIELCFQTASLSGLAMQSRLGLPYGIQELKVFSLPDNMDESLFALITVNSDDSYDGKLMDGKGNVYMMLRGYKTMDLPDPVQADLLKPLQRALQAECVI